MWLGRCISALGGAGGAGVAQQLEAAGAASLLQRLQSGLQCSTSAAAQQRWCHSSAAASTSSSSSSSAGAIGGSGGAGSHSDQPWRPHLQLPTGGQQQQQRLRRQRSGGVHHSGHLALEAAAPFGARAFARLARRAAPRRGDAGSTPPPPRGGGAGGAPAPLGRRAANCVALGDLPAAREQRELLRYADDPWRFHSPLNDRGPPAERASHAELAPPGPLPRAFDGEHGEDHLQYALAMREQIEKSALPPEMKRAAFDQPWSEILLDARRTVKVTAKGRLETLHVTTAVGNGRGLLGIGMTAGSDLQKVMLNSLLAAYRNAVPVPLYRGHTIYHPIDHTFRKLRIRMWPRHRNFGLTASPLIETLCGLAGLSNATVKLNGRRRNIDNVVKAFMHAVTSQGLPHDGVEGSGVYVREVYHRGKLPLGLQRGVDV